jgi:Ni,Fe-hydrogenase III component G
VSEAEAANNKSVTELLNSVKEKHDRLIRNRNAVHQESTKLPMEEKLLRDAMEHLEYYKESVLRLGVSVENRRKRLAFALEYCKQHDEDYTKLKMAEDLAKKIARLQKEITEKKLKMVAELA